MSYGWAGTILRVDLTENKITKQPFPNEWGTKFAGGSGVNDWILWEEVGPDVDPLSPDNRANSGSTRLSKRFSSPITPAQVKGFNSFDLRRHVKLPVGASLRQGQGFQGLGQIP